MLTIASFGDSKPLKLTFASVKPLSTEPSVCETLETSERWGPKPEITHTFREPQKLPNKALSAIFTLGVIAGIPLLLVLVRPSLKSLTQLKVRSCIGGYFIVEYGNDQCA